MIRKNESGGTATNDTDMVSTTQKPIAENQFNVLKECESVFGYDSFEFQLYQNIQYYMNTQVDYKPKFGAILQPLEHAVPFNFFKDKKVFSAYKLNKVSFKKALLNLQEKGFISIEQRNLEHYKNRTITIAKLVKLCADDYKNVKSKQRDVEEIKNAYEMRNKYYSLQDRCNEKYGTYNVDVALNNLDERVADLDKRLALLECDNIRIKCDYDDLKQRFEVVEEDYFANLCADADDEEIANGNML